MATAREYLESILSNMSTLMNMDDEELEREIDTLRQIDNDVGMLVDNIEYPLP